MRYEVAGEIDRAAAMVKMRGKIVLEASAIDGDLVPLWLYPDRTRHVPPSTTDLTLDRLFPSGFSRGGFARVTTRVAGCAPKTWPQDGAADAVRGRLLRVSICPSAERPIVVHFDGELHVPQRYGTFGATSSAFTLGDPWYPLVMAKEGVPLRGAHALSMRWDQGVLVTGLGVARKRGSEPHRFDVVDVTHAPLAVVDASAVHEEIFGGVHVTLVMRNRLPPAEPEGTGFWESDPTGATLVTVRRSVELMRRLGFVAFERERGPGRDGRATDPRRMSDRLVVVELPERERLAVALPGMIALSDRAFRLLPFDRVQKFHELAVARRIFTALLTPRVEATEPLADRSWVADLDGSALVDLSLALERSGRDRPQDLIGFAGFHPAVDQMLYAPRVAFRSAYFHDIEERDPDRDGADRAFNAMPFGHLVLEKLRDRLGAGVGGVLDAHLLRGTPFRTAAQGATRRDLAPFFRTWLGPLPKLAYRLANWSSTPSVAGARSPSTSSASDTPSYEHRVTVERLGATWVEEPVVVELVDQDGKRIRRTWDAAGARGEVSWTSNAPLADAMVDPDGRLIQDPSLTAEHPRFDDELKHVWRPPIFSSFAVSLSVTELRPDAVMDFLLKRRYDVRQWFGVSAATTARGLSGRLRYARGVGPLRDLNGTMGSITGSVSGLRSETGFGGSRVPVTQADVALNFSWNTRIEPLNPRNGWGFGAAISAGAARQDAVTRADGTRAESTLYPSASVAVRGELVHALHPHHILAGAAGAGATACPALAQQLQVLSGRQLLRGFAADELIGCSAAYAIAEYRWMAISGLYWNTAQIAWFKGLELVPFAAGGLLSSRDDAVPRHFHAEVGGGVRGFFDWGGVQPGLVAIDVGVPLSRSSNTYVDADGLLRRRSPYGLYLSFEQAL